MSLDEGSPRNEFRGVPQPASYPVLLKPEQWALIERALLELPAKVVNPLLADINRQMRDAHAAAIAAEKPQSR